MRRARSRSCPSLIRDVDSPFDGRTRFTAAESALYARNTGVDVARFITGKPGEIAKSRIRERFRIGKISRRARVL